MENDKNVLKIRKEIMQRDNFTCQKCNFQDPSSEELELYSLNQNLITLCSICHNYAPDSEKEFKSYINEKIDGRILNTFRKSKYSLSKKTKQGMTDSFNKGKHITKAPKGYRIINKELHTDEQESKQVLLIFKEFLNTNTSLTRLAKKHNMTTSGIKKLLQNTTYLGKVKFAKQESNGKHRPIINKELFNKIQEKLRK